MNPDASTLIEDYLLGKLGAAEARAVEQRAETDAAFARELQLQGDIFMGIELYGEEKIKAAIAGVDKSLEAGAPTPYFSTYSIARSLRNGCCDSPR